MDISKQTFSTLTFKQILVFESYNDNEKNLNIDIQTKFNALMEYIFNDVNEIVAKRFEEAEKEFDVKFENLIKAAVKKIVLHFCKLKSDEKHFFIWGEDLKCDVCKGEIYDEIHIDEIGVEIPDVLSEEDIQNITILDEEVFSDEDL